MSKIIQIGNIFTRASFSNPTVGRVYSVDGLSPTLNTNGGGYHLPMIIVEDNGEQKAKKHPKYRIRKLTPRECFRLMDVDDADIDNIQRTGICNSQQYKLAGNSIAISPLYHLFRKMFVEQGNEEQQLKLF